MSQAKQAEKANMVGYLDDAKIDCCLTDAPSLPLLVALLLNVSLPPPILHYL